MLFRAHPALVARASAAATVLLGAAFCAADGPSEGRRQVPQVIVLNDNGAWSWFEDERAVVDPVTGTLVVSSVADASGTGGMTRDGNVEVATHDLAAGTTRREVLHAHLQDDDHNSAALYVRPDGGTWRCTRRTPPTRSPGGGCADGPADAAAWGPERTLDHGVDGDVLQRLPRPATASGSYAFVRTPVATRTSSCRTMMASPGDLGGGCWTDPDGPYVRYAADRHGRIHILDDRAAPARSAPTSIYHGVDRRPSAAPIRRHGRRRRPVRRRRRPTGATDAACSRPETGSEHGPSTYRWTETGGRTPRSRFTRRATSTGTPASTAECGTRTSWPTPAVRCTAARRTTPVSSRSIQVIRAASSCRPTFIPTTGVPLISAADGRQHHELFEGSHH